MQDSQKPVTEAAVRNALREIADMTAKFDRALEGRWTGQRFGDRIEKQGRRLGRITAAMALVERAGAETRERASRQPVSQAA